MDTRFIADQPFGTLHICTMAQVKRPEAIQPLEAEYVRYA